MIKAIFFDIDGTLVSFDTHKIPLSAVKALEEVRKKGIKVFIATGRPKPVINNLGDLKFDGYITMNGGYCIADDRVVYKNGILPGDIDSLIRYQQEVESFPCIFVGSNSMFINYINEDVTAMLNMLDFPVPPTKDIENAQKEEIFQIVSFFGKHREEEIMPIALPNCEATRWNPLFTDVIAKGNGKNVGIDKILKHYGIELNEAMAFGDGGNDIAMLKHVPLSIAMGNADDKVKKHASYITDSVDDDGVRNALKHFGII